MGDYSIRQYRNLAKRLNIPLNELLQLKDTYLQPVKNQTDIETQLEILVYLIKDYLKKESHILKLINKNSKITNSYVLKALEYIERNFTKNITVPDVAKICFISVPYLQNLFCEFLGHGIAEEIRNRRITYAKELLCSTEYSVKRIAFECGFDSADYFSVVFKKLCDTTPLKFRKSHSL
jgi:YesN/AraC family two-component response regulator